MELRRKLPSPQDPVVVDDILGETPAGHALAHIHLVLNYNTNPKNAQGCYNLHGKNSRSNNPEQDKGGPASEPSRGHSGSRQHSTNNNKSVLSKQASGSTRHDNAPDDPSESGEDDRQRQRQSPEETLPGDDNAPDPGHPGDGEDDNAHQGPDQPGEDDSSQQGLDKISERYGRPRVEIFAVRANFHVTDMRISVFDGIRGQIIYMPKDQGEQVNIVSYYYLLEIATENSLSFSPDTLPSFCFQSPNNTCIQSAHLNDASLY